jgi:hypothetical protein
MGLSSHPARGYDKWTQAGDIRAVVMRNAATNVQEVIVPNAGHWLMEEASMGLVTSGS